jgi:hypothetical protein
MEAGPAIHSFAVPLVRRFAPRAGLVALRQTFVRRYQVAGPRPA